MTFRIILIVVLTFCFAMSAPAAMVRVVDIQEGPTLIVERDGVRSPIRLAGVAVTNEPGARELLRWTIDRRWVKIEPAAAGGHLIWRTPDALFINRELVLRGFATATMPGIEPEPRVIVTYLGVIDPVGAQPAAKPESKLKSADSPKKRSGTSRRSTKRRSPKAPSRSAPPSG